MRRSDLVIATGGQGLVRAAYSSGTPAYGVGAGNATEFVDETADIQETARNCMLSKTSDFGSGCSADGNVLVPSSRYQEMLEALEAEGGYLATSDERAALQAVMWDDEGHRLPDTVAVSPQALAAPQDSTSLRIAASSWSRATASPRTSSSARRSSPR